MEKVFAFLLDLESVEGTNIQRRIKEVTSKGHEVSISYKQKVESFDLQKEHEKKPIVFNRNIDFFSTEQMQVVTTNLKDYFQQFNYFEEVAADSDLFTVTPEWL